MTQPDDDASGEDLRPFSRSPLSPSGVEYFVQAVPGFGAASGRIMLAKEDGIPTLLTDDQLLAAWREQLDR